MESLLFVACIVLRSLVSLACALFYVTKISILKSNTLIIVDRASPTTAYSAIQNLFIPLNFSTKLIEQHLIPSQKCSNNFSIHYLSTKPIYYTGERISLLKKKKKLINISKRNRGTSKQTLLSEDVYELYTVSTRLFLILLAHMLNHMREQYRFHAKIIFIRVSSFLLTNT